MSDIFGDIGRLGSEKRQACRVAYTINNTQPVVCSIIDDQPLFYMDYDIDYEDSDMVNFDAGDIKILEGELLNLRNELRSFDKFSSSFLQTPEARHQKFLNDKNTVTRVEIKTKSTSDETRLVEILSRSRMAQAYVAFAKEHDVNIKLNPQIQDAQYDRKAALIFVNPNLDLTDQVLLTVRELRRHWQHRQGALINPLMFHPDNAVLINRVQIADLATSMIRVAWELQLSGCKETWRRIENSPMADLGHSFAREAFLDFRTLNNGQAAVAVFESWFLSERCCQEDKKMIQQMLADYKGYVFDLHEARETITPALIAALGTMPYGKNYLAQHTLTIMNDPVFTEVRDRSNANFLWFIKFERSFRETEQELQTSPDLSTEGFPPSGINSTAQERKHGAQSTGQIIPLFPETKDQAGGGKKAENRKESADIIYLRRWSGE